MRTSSRPAPCRQTRLPVRERGRTLQRPTFVSRVEALRDSWSERRTLLRIASAHDFESQFRLLLTLYDWATEAVEDVAAVYDRAVPLMVSPRPGRRVTEPSFSVSIAGHEGILFTLAERKLAGGSRWNVTAALTAGGRDGAVSHAGPERRNGGWTRSRVEDLLLSLLGAYERSRGEEVDSVPFTESARASGQAPHGAAS